MLGRACCRARGRRFGDSEDAPYPQAAAAVQPGKFAPRFGILSRFVTLRKSACSRLILIRDGTQRTRALACRPRTFVPYGSPQTAIGFLVISKSLCKMVECLASTVAADLGLIRSGSGPGCIVALITAEELGLPRRGLSALCAAMSLQTLGLKKIPPHKASSAPRRPGMLRI